VTATVEVTIDAVDAAAAADFWCAALDYEVRYHRQAYRALGPKGGADGFVVIVQEVASHSAGKARVHLDLRVDDPAAEVRRLEHLGATVEAYVDERISGGSGWWVLRDPEGTHFCVCPARDGPPR
jgi:predicted enzyme related to lactoylglutathione lyase